MPLNSTGTDMSGRSGKERCRESKFLPPERGKIDTKLEKRVKGLLGRMTLEEKIAPLYELGLGTQDELAKILDVVTEYLRRVK